jgi:hypothetical protein
VEPAAGLPPGVGAVGAGAVVGTEAGGVVPGFVAGRGAAGATPVG